MKVAMTLRIPLSLPCIILTFFLHEIEASGFEKHLC